MMRAKMTTVKEAFHLLAIL